MWVDEPIQDLGRQGADWRRARTLDRVMPDFSPELRYRTESISPHG